MSKKEIKFEDALTALENCVRRLEDGSLSLDDAISSYEEAVRLVKICNERLQTAEKKVRILTEGQDGAITDAPFILDDED